MAALGFYMLRWGRTVPQEGADDGSAPLLGPLATLLGGLSLQSRYLIGLCLMALGYHAVSYSLPAGVLWLRVPPERLWIMGTAIAVAVAGSLVLDTLERG